MKNLDSNRTGAERNSDADDNANQHAYKEFVRDKRTRIPAGKSDAGNDAGGRRGADDEPQNNPYNNRYNSYPRSSNSAAAPRRRSFNPNFDANNRLVGRRDDDSYQGRREYSGDGERGGRFQREPNRYQDRTSGRDGYERANDRRQYGERQYGERTQRQYGERGGEYPYGERKYGERSERPYGERKSAGRYGERRDYRNGDRNFYGDRNNAYNGDRNNSYGSGSYGDRSNSYSDRSNSYNNSDRVGYGERSYGERGDRNSNYGDRNKSYGSGSYGERNYGNSYGGRKQSFRDGGKKGFRQQGAQKKSARRTYDAENYPTYPVPVTEDKIRLNRYISMSGICSRREADEYIQAGVVTVNGLVVTELGARVAQTDEIRFHGEVIKNERKVYIVMNKPKGYVTSLDDPHADKTVMDLLKNCCRERVYPVGRLDKNSLGVLLITNDGDMAKKLMHPSYEKKKIYQVSLDKPLTAADMTALAEGFELEDGEIHADSVSYVAEKKTEVGIEIHSGRNRIVRRMFEHLGYRVVKLDRVYFAGLTKKNLKRGEWRFLTPREVQNLQSGQYE